MPPSILTRTQDRPCSGPGEAPVPTAPDPEHLGPAGLSAGRQKRGVDATGNRPLAFVATLRDPQAGRWDVQGVGSLGVAGRGSQGGRGCGRAGHSSAGLGLMTNPSRLVDAG